MAMLSVWWGRLQPLDQWFYAAAAFFSVLFLWQLVAAFAGLAGGGTDLDTHAEPTWDHDTPADAQGTVVAFQLLSLRSVLAFFTLFTWAGALYLNAGVPATRALVYALLWGAAAMGLAAWLLFAMRRMAETGNPQIATCVGHEATVYLHIPAGGQGEVRMLCSGVMTHLKARVAGGAPLKAGAVATVTRVVGPNIVEVNAAAPCAAGKDATP